MSNNLIVIASLASGSTALRSGNFCYCTLPCDAIAFKDVIAQALGADEQLLESMLKWPDEYSGEYQKLRAGAQFWKVKTTRALSKELSSRCRELRKIAAALELKSPALSVTVGAASAAEKVFQYLNNVDEISVQI